MSTVGQGIADKPFGDVVFSEKAEGYGKEIWDQGDEYEGEFFRNTAHGKGVYRWKNPQVYEGSFFSNRKEGYSLLSLPNNSYFQGLFINNEPFGPGILTHSNGTQDVGFWVGQKLVRLIRTVDLIVPRLASTSEAKAKLLKFRSLVLLSEKNSDSAIEIQKKLNFFLHRFFSPYSKLISDPRSIFFDRITFENKYFARSNSLKGCGAGDRRLEKLQPQKGYAEAFAVKVLPRSLPELSGEPAKKEVQSGNGSLSFVKKKTFSWNKNKLCTDMLKQVYSHRGFEKMINFEVEKLVSGIRHAFRRAGENESRCLQFLKLCSLGPPSFLKDFLCNFAISEELIDARGNNGLMFAAATDQHDVIDILSDYGVDINAFNDENLTPLNLCLLRRLALANKISNWGEAFLPSDPSKPFDLLNEDEECELWEFDRSFLKVFGSEVSSNDRAKEFLPNEANKKGDVQSNNRHNSILESSSEEEVSMDLQRNYGKTSREDYFFELDPNKKIKEEKNFGKGKENSWIGLKTEEEEGDADLKSMIEKVDGTIEKLLKRGADPNISEVPKPSIHLGIFTKDVNLVQNLLSYGARPDSRLHPDEGNLTPLHVLVLLDPSPEYVKICEILLKFGADPEEETLPGFTITESKSEKVFFESSRGRTPLQLLCMRPDFQSANPKECLVELALLLAKASDQKNLSDDTSALKFATLHGNTSLVRSLLESKHVVVDNSSQTGLRSTLSKLKKTPNANAAKLSHHSITSATNPLKKIKASKSFSGTDIEKIGELKTKRKQNKEAKNKTKGTKTKKAEVENLADQTKKRLKNEVSKEKSPKRKNYAELNQKFPKKKIQLQKRGVRGTKEKDETPKYKKENPTAVQEKKTKKEILSKKSEIPRNKLERRKVVPKIKEKSKKDLQETKEEKRKKNYKSASRKSKGLEVFSGNTKRSKLKKQEKDQQAKEYESEKKKSPRPHLNKYQAYNPLKKVRQRGGGGKKRENETRKKESGTMGRESGTRKKSEVRDEKRSQGTRTRFGAAGESPSQRSKVGQSMSSFGSSTFPRKVRRSFLKMFGNGFCLDNDELLLPYVVLRDGNLYYRFQGKATARKEQYSLI